MRKEAIAAIIIIFLSFLAVIIVTIYKPTKTAIVETRSEHLIWSSKSCKVYQVVIKNEWGTHILFITTPAIKQTLLRQAVYPTCRVTALP